MGWVGVAGTRARRPRTQRPQAARGRWWRQRSRPGGSPPRSCLARRRRCRRHHLHVTSIGVAVPPPPSIDAVVVLYPFPSLRFPIFPAGRRGRSARSHAPPPCWRCLRPRAAAPLVEPLLRLSPPPPPSLPPPLRPRFCPASWALLSSFDICKARSRVTHSVIQRFYRDKDASMASIPTTEKDAYVRSVGAGKRSPTSSRLLLDAMYVSMR